MITAEDRLKFPHHSESSILGIKLISGLTNAAIEEFLQNVRGNGIYLPIIKSKTYEAVECLMTMGGGKVNPIWIRARILNEAYERDIIDAQEFDYLLR